MNFAEAIKLPKGGWSHANDEQLLAFFPTPWHGIAA